MRDDDDRSRGDLYGVDHTPWGIAEIDDIVLSLRESDDGRHTRRVIRPHSGVKDGERRLSIGLIHQRFDPALGLWVNDHIDLRALKAGEAVALDLDSEQTAKLREHLNRLFAVNERLKSERGTEYRVAGPDEVVVPRERAELIDRLVGSGDPDTVAHQVAELAPHLAAAAGLLEQHRVRSTALAEFKAHLKPDDEWTERDWQRFFEQNDWIFGHNLDYRFLVTEQAQPSYGGADVTGSGGQAGDFLMGTVADSRFATLVEIKKPGTSLLGGARYRNGAWRASDELAGGVAQVQANCQQWLTQSRQLPNVDWAQKRGLTTAQPRGILLIGKTGRLQDRDQRESFERFRRHLWNPEVLTYDELYKRARYIVSRSAAGPEPDGPPPGEPAHEPDDYEPEPEDLAALDEAGYDPDYEPDSMTGTTQTS
jgi:hypothetical protein